jgi:symplekin
MFNLFTVAVLQATKLCFQDKKIYSQEVMSIVLQQLMELPNIPYLFMRTVIQSHTTFPKILGFIVNILQRLIVKQVKHKSNLVKRRCRNPVNGRSG